MNELGNLVDDLRSVYGELFPQRNPEAMRLSDDVLALGVLVMREVRKLQPAVSPSPAPDLPKPFVLHGKILDRIAKHNPKDSE